MEQADQDLLLALTANEPRLKKLYQEHIKLEKEVEKFEKYTSFSPSAKLKQRELKKAKLRGMDEIMTILKTHRSGEGGLSLS